MHFVWPSSDFWQAAAQVSNVLTALAVIVAIPFAILQVQQATRARHLEAIARVFEEFRSDTFFRNRRFVYQHEPFDYATCTEEERLRIEDLIGTFNRMALLVEHGLAPAPIIFEMWSGSVVATWGKLSGYIYARRKALDFPDWAIQFEHLARRSEKYRAKALKSKVR